MRYSGDYVEGVSENEADFDSDDIMGEAIYDEEYKKNRKQKTRSSSEDEEYHWDEEENLEEEDEEEAEDDSFSGSDESEGPRRKRQARPVRATRAKTRAVREIQPGLRRSKRSNRPRINYQQYEYSDTDAESTVPDETHAADGVSDRSIYSEEEEQDLEQEQELGQGQEQEQGHEQEKEKIAVKESVSPERRPRYLDLNEIAPGSGFDDGSGFMVKDDEKAGF